MSKLYNKYLELKNIDKESLYLFKSGIFYIFLDKDAEFISNLLHLKLTKLNDNVVKCGFPTTHLDKYICMIKPTGKNIKIIDDTTAVESNDYLLNKDLNTFIDYFLSKDIDYIGISDAYELLYETKKIFKKIKYKD